MGLEAPRCFLISPIRLKTFCSARARTEQVLKSITSAVSDLSDISYPAPRRRDEALSVSAMFI